MKFNLVPIVNEYEIQENASESSDGEEPDEGDNQSTEKIVAEQQNYLYNKREMELLRSVKKPFHKFLIPPDDPVFKNEYNDLFFRDREAKKSFYN